MGAYTPLTWAPPDLVDEVLATVLQPTRRRDGPARHAVRRAAVRRPRADRARPAGRSSSTSASATPRSSRCWPLLDSPAGRRCSLAAADGTLADVPAPVWQDGAAVTVVLACRRLPGVLVDGRRDHRRRRRRGASTASTSSTPAPRSAGDDLVTAGGRVLAVIAHRRRRRRGAGRGVRRRRPRSPSPASSAARDIAAEPLGVVEGASLRTSHAGLTRPTGVRRSMPGRRRCVGEWARDRPERPRHPLRRRRPGRDLVPRAQDRARAAALDRGARGPARPRHRRARRRRRGLRRRRRQGRPRVDRGPRAGHPPRREGADRGVLARSPGTSTSTRA